MNESNLLHNLREFNIDFADNKTLIIFLLLLLIVALFVFKSNLILFIVAIVIVIGVFRSRKCEKFDACGIDPSRDRLNAAYEITLPIQFNHHDDSKRSYMNAKYELTPLTDTPGFKDIWRAEPEDCGEFSMPPEFVSPVSEIYPGQCNYIVRSKVDHLPISQAQTNLIEARPIVEQSYSDDMLAFRSSIMNEHIDRFRRERQHNCADMRLNSFSAGSGGP